MKWFHRTKRRYSAHGSEHRAAVSRRAVTPSLSSPPARRAHSALIHDVRAVRTDAHPSAHVVSKRREQRKTSLKQRWAPKAVKATLAQYVPTGRRNIVNATVLVACALVLTINLFMPADTARAERMLTWSDNADFAFNKTSQCQATTITSLAISAAPYSDQTCSQAGADASVSLAGVKPSFLEGITAISVGDGHSLAVKSDGTVWAWGYNNNGQLGSGSTTSSRFPVQVQNPDGSGFLTDAKVVAAGSNFSLAVKNDGTVWAWGYNGFGQLGNGVSDITNTRPVQVRNSDGSGFLTDVKLVSAGSNHSLAVKNDGTVWAWGLNSNGQLGNSTTTSTKLPVQVQNPDGSGFLTDAKAVAAGSVHSLSLKNDGTVWAWGQGSSRQLGNGSSIDTSRPVQVQNPDGSGFLTDVKAISAGSNFSLAVKNDGTVWAWGTNTYGQLGDGSTSSRARPVQVQNPDGSGFLADVKAISAGSNFSLAVKNDGTVWAWGRNVESQLGNGATANSVVRPVQVQNPDGSGFLTDAKAVAAGNNFSLAVKNDGTVWAWGTNTYGQLGDGSVGNKTRPVQTQRLTANGSLSDVRTVSAGSNFSLALKNDGTVWAWGRGGSGQLGDGSTIDAPRPIQTQNSDGTGFLTDIKAVSSVGADFSLALKNDGTVWAWGNGSNGRLGNGTASVAYRPVQVQNTNGTGFLTDIKAVSAGSGGHSLALKNDGTVWGWGNDVYGQLGDGTTASSVVRPVQVQNSDGTGFLTDIKAVSAGNSFSLALKSDGTVWAWGYGGNSQLGNGTTGSATRPVQVQNSDGSSSLADVKAVAAGNYHSLALKNDGTVWAWGRGGSGQLGNGTTGSATRPVQVQNSDGSSSLADVKAVSVGADFSLALKNDGTVWAWGYGSNGQLGNGTTTATNTRPIQAKNSDSSGFLTDMTAISAGSNHTLAVKSDGTTWSWGSNAYGQVGRGYQPGASYSTPDYVTSAGEGYAGSGSLSGLVVDFGSTKRTQWQTLNWTTDSLPEKATVAFALRTSSDGMTWSDWTPDFVQDATGSVSGSADLADIPMSRFVELKLSMTSESPIVTPVLHDVSLSFLNDTVGPITNATNIVVTKGNGGATVADNAWTNKAHLTWDAGVDDGLGTGIWGYCVYVGKDATANVTQSKGLLGDSPIDSNGACPYVLAGTELDLSAPGVLAQDLQTSQDTYYVRIKAIDNSGNLYDGEPTQASFRYDNTPPTNPQFISAPSQFIASKDVTLTWSTSGSAAPSDVGSGVKGLQYRIGSDGTWYGDQHTGNQDDTDLLTNDGSYTTINPVDYDRLGEGNNIVAFRTYDEAGNVAAANITTVIKINTSSPSAPQNLSVTPATSTTNKFAFEWLSPASFQGAESSLTYCYTINVTPTASNCTYLDPGETSLPAGPYATQPGENTIYVVARDEAGNVNYATAASETFTANTSAPGVPLNLDVADISVKATSNWKLTVAWESPTNTGAGVANYRVLRSTDNVTYTQVATTSGTSYVDTGLKQQRYYYKIRACDSANNCGVATESVNRTPNGRFTSPATIVANPSVQVKNRSAKITWVTDRTSDSRVQLGVSSGKYFEAETAKSDQVKEHSIVLNNLQPDTAYFYKARWTDEDGNIGSSSELIFRTLPAPAVKDVTVDKIGLNSSTLRLTSKGSARVKVYYGTSDRFGSVKEINTSTQESTYAVELDGLSDGTKYFYKINTIDSEGNEYDSSRIDSFTTPARPRIENLRFQPVKGEPTSTQRVTWETNVPTTSMIRYRADKAPLKEVSNSTYTTKHSITIEGLLDDSLYSLTAESRDKIGNVTTSGAQTFRTALDTRPPETSELRVETSIRGVGREAKGQLVVSWHTDEPATSRVAYGKGASGTTYASSTNEDNTLTTEHMVVISELDTSQVYHIQPVSRDKSGNISKGTDRSAIIGQPSDSAIDIILGTLERIFGL